MVVGAALGYGGDVAGTVRGRFRGRGANAVVDYAVHVQVEIVDARGGIRVEFGVNQRIALRDEAEELGNTWFFFDFFLVEGAVAKEIKLEGLRFGCVGGVEGIAR